MLSNTEPNVADRGLYSIKETMNVLGIKSSKTLAKYTQNGLINCVYHCTNKKMYQGSEIKKFWSRKY